MAIVSEVAYTSDLNVAGSLQSTSSDRENLRVASQVPNVRRESRKLRWSLSINTSAKNHDGPSTGAPVILKSTLSVLQRSKCASRSETKTASVINRQFH